MYSVSSRGENEEKYFSYHALPPHQKRDSAFSVKFEAVNHTFRQHCLKIEDQQIVE